MISPQEACRSPKISKRKPSRQSLDIHSPHILSIKERVKFHQYRECRAYNKFGSLKISIPKTLNTQEKWTYLVVKVEEYSECDPELARLRRIEHPNLMNYYGHFMLHQHLCLVFEYFSVDMRKCNSTGLGKCHGLSKAIIYQILQALVYLHRQRVAYLALTDSNILISSSGNVKLLNHTAYHRNWLDSLSPSRRSCTLWQSPEQLQGLATASSVKSDIFSLGLILYKSYHGKDFCRPSKDPLERAQKLARRCQRLADEEPVTNQRRQVFESFLKSCLKIDESQRLSAEELLGHKWLDGVRKLGTAGKIRHFTKKGLRHIFS